MKDKGDIMYKRNNKYKTEVTDGTYRVVETLYRKGYDFDEILVAVRGLDRMTMLDMVQRIFALDQMRKEERS